MPAGFPNESTYDALLQQAGEANGVDWLFLKAIVAQESASTPALPGRAGDQRRQLRADANPVCHRPEPGIHGTGLRAIQPGHQHPVWRAVRRPPGAPVRRGPGQRRRQLQRRDCLQRPERTLVSKSGNPTVQNYVDKVLGYYALYQADAGIGPPDATGGATSPDWSGTATETTPTGPEPTGDLLSEAEAAVSGVWQTVSDALGLATPEDGSRSGYRCSLPAMEAPVCSGSPGRAVALAVAGAVGVWLVWEAVA